MKNSRILTFVLLLITGNLIAQSALNSTQDDTDPIIYLIKFNGDTIKGYPNINKEIFSTSLVENTFNSTHPYGEINSAFWYYNDQGKNVFLSFNDLKDFETIEVLDKSVHYERIELETFSVFREIIARSGNLILFTRMTTNGAYYNILDTKSKEFKLKKSRYHSRDGKFYLKNDKKGFNKYLKKYFSNCPELLNLIEANLIEANYKGDIWITSIGGRLFKGIVNYQCK